MKRSKPIKRGRLMKAGAALKGTAAPARGRRRRRPVRDTGPETGRQYERARLQGAR